HHVGHRRRVVHHGLQAAAARKVFRHGPHGGVAHEALEARGHARRHAAGRAAAATRARPRPRRRRGAGADRRAAGARRRLPRRPRRRGGERRRDFGAPRVERRRVLQRLHLLLGHPQVPVRRREALVGAHKARLDLNRRLAIVERVDVGGLVDLGRRPVGQVHGGAGAARQGGRVEALRFRIVFAQQRVVARRFERLGRRNVLGGRRAVCRAIGVGGGGVKLGPRRRHPRVIVGRALRDAVKELGLFEGAEELVKRRRRRRRRSSPAGGRGRRGGSAGGGRDGGYAERSRPRLIDGDEGGRVGRRGGHAAEVIGAGESVRGGSQVARLGRVRVRGGRQVVDDGGHRAALVRVGHGGGRCRAQRRARTYRGGTVIGHRSCQRQVGVGATILVRARAMTTG
ncbi:hypothetical protein BU14_2605s0001, partial [Porphyra umbilicalis]